MFPEYEYDEEIEQEFEDIEQDDSRNSVIVEFDFKIGEFSLIDGSLKLISGKAKLEQWINKVLATEKGENEIEPSYGVEIKKVIFSGYPKMYIKAEVCRIIEEVLLENEEILGVSDFNFTRTGKNTILSFTIETIYGDIEREVSLYV